MTNDPTPLKSVNLFIKFLTFTFFFGGAVLKYHHMGKIASKRRSFEIRKKQKRAQELAKLRKLYSQAKTKTEKEKILTKVFRLAPYLSQKEFLASLPK